MPCTETTPRISRSKLIRNLERGLEDERVRPETKAKAKRALRLLKKIEERKLRKEARSDGTAF